MSYRSTYDKGKWLSICDECGKKVKSSELKKRWDGLMVCPKDWEPRQPQDFIRAKVDIQATPWNRPESSDTFIPINYFHFEEEDLPLVENFRKSWTTSTSIPSESFSFLENLVTSVGKRVGETLSLSDSVSKAVGQVQNESLSLVDSISKTITLLIRTPLFGSELNAYSLNGQALNGTQPDQEVVGGEKLSMSESYTRVWTISRTNDESLSLVENISLVYGSNTSLNGASLNSLSLG